MKTLTVVGTRPEAIKMAPVLRALETCNSVDSRLCVTGQHRDLLDPALHLFGLTPDIDLGLMEPEQPLNLLCSRAVAALDRVLVVERPDRVIVQGDTATAFAGALAAFQRRIPVAHVEAGLRTGDNGNPWPEEAYREGIDAFADLLFAPTALAAANLGDAPGRTILVTGNSGVDATHWVLGRLARDRALRRAADSALPTHRPDGPLLLVTIHRRESLGKPLERVCAAIARIAAGGAQVVLPVHPNPEVGRTVRGALGDRRGIVLIDPLPLPAMIRLMQRADLILTDSGGVQEEAATLGKPALVLRSVTDRPESVAAGMARLTGTDTDAIVSAADEEVARMHLRPVHQVLPNPFGDGGAAERVVAALLGEPVRPFAVGPAEPPPVPISLVG